MIHCMSFLAAFKVGAWLHKLKGWWRCARFVVQGKLVGFILFFQNIALLFLPQERILVNRFGSRGLSKFVLETWIRKCIDREGLGRRANLYPFIECFHMTSRRPYWCPKTMKRRPCWCPKPVLWELNSFLMQNAFFCSNKFAYMLATWVKTLYTTGWNKCNMGSLLGSLATTTATACYGNVT